MRIMLKPMYIILLIVAAMVGMIGLLVLGTSIRMHKGTSPHAMRRLAHIHREAWIRLNERTIFFGHKSVGNNIVDGIRDIVAGHESLNLNIVEMKHVNKIECPMFAHAQVGRNLDPESKIAEFKMLMESGLAEKVDIAFFKFCFVDIMRTSNPDAILADYCEAINKLKLRYPHVVFVHVTVPLCGLAKKVKGILKSIIKRLIGRSSILDDNLVRARYNTLLRKRFSGKEALFDLAFYEALGPDGLRHYSFRDGREVPILVRSYTDDGGHLNVMGRRHVAEQLLIKLLDLADTGQSCGMY